MSHLVCFLFACACAMSCSAASPLYELPLEQSLSDLNLCSHRNDTSSCKAEPLRMALDYDNQHFIHSNDRDLFRNL